MTENTISNHSIKIQIETIKLNLTTSFGKIATFDNGCTINLTPKDGYFFGTNPYDIDWICENKDDYMQAIAEWVNYWDAPRIETGALI